MATAIVEKLNKKANISVGTIKFKIDLPFVRALKIPTVWIPIFITGLVFSQYVLGSRKPSYCMIPKEFNRDQAEFASYYCFNELVSCDLVSSEGSASNETCDAPYASHVNLYRGYPFILLSMAAAMYIPTFIFQIFAGEIISSRLKLVFKVIDQIYQKSKEKKTSASSSVAASAATLQAHLLKWASSTYLPTLYISCYLVQVALAAVYFSVMYLCYNALYYDNFICNIPLKVAPVPEMEPVLCSLPSGPAYRMYSVIFMAILAFAMIGTLLHLVSLFWRRTPNLYLVNTLPHLPANIINFFEPSHKGKVLFSDLHFISLYCKENRSNFQFYSKKSIFTSHKQKNLRSALTRRFQLHLPEEAQSRRTINRYLSSLLFQKDLGTGNASMTGSFLPMRFHGTELAGHVQTFRVNETHAMATGSGLDLGNNSSLAVACLTALEFLSSAGGDRAQSDGIFPFTFVAEDDEAELLGVLDRYLAIMQRAASIWRSNDLDILSAAEFVGREWKDNGQAKGQEGEKIEGGDWGLQYLETEGPSLEWNDDNGLQTLAHILGKLVKTREDSAVVVTVSSKTFAILIRRDGAQALFDSHFHFDVAALKDHQGQGSSAGALIAYAEKEYLTDMASFIFNIMLPKELKVSSRFGSITQVKSTSPALVSKGYGETHV